MASLLGGPRSSGSRFIEPPEPPVLTPLYTIDIDNDWNGRNTSVHPSGVDVETLSALLQAVDRDKLLRDVAPPSEEERCENLLHQQRASAEVFVTISATCDCARSRLFYVLE